MKNGNMQQTNVTIEEVNRAAMMIFDGIIQDEIDTQQARAAIDALNVVTENMKTRALAMGIMARATDSATVAATANKLGLLQNNDGDKK